MDTFGRKDKLFELQKAWAVALSGRPRIVFVDGEQGVGKSHLVNTFLEMIRDQQTTEKRPLIGHARCFEVDGFSEPLRPAWDGLAELLAERVRHDGPADYRCLPGVTRLSAVVPDAHLARVGAPLARLLCDEHGNVRIPRDKFLASPEILIRDSLLTLSAEQPVALFIDELELADASTLTLLANLVDVLWEQDQPFYFLLVLAYQPTLAHSRGMLQRLEEHLQRHDRPNNRIISRVRVDGLGHPGIAALAEHALGGIPLGDEAVLDWLAEHTGGNPRTVRDLVRGLHARGLLENRSGRLQAVDTLEEHTDGWNLPSQIEHWLGLLGDEPHRQAAFAAGFWLDEWREDSPRELLAMASLQGRRFSPATLAAVSGRDELEVVRLLSQLTSTGMVRRASGPAPFDFFGHGVFEFTSPLYVQTLRETLSPEERQILHGRIANHLLLQRGRLRDGRERLSAEQGEQRPETISERFARDADKLDAALRALNHILVGHLEGAGRALETTRFLSEALRALAPPAYPNEFALAEQARQVVGLTRLAERTLLSLAAIQPRSEPAEVVRAAFDVAIIAADCRVRMGCYETALALLDDALRSARWLEARDLELRALSRQLIALYRSGQHRRAREVFEEAITEFRTSALPADIIELFSALQRLEHPDVSVRRLQDIAESIDRLGRSEIADAAYTLVLQAHAQMLFERWDSGDVGHADLADVAKQARAQGFAEQWLEILLQKFDARVREERVLHGWFYLQSREPLGLIRAAIELLERSRRMAEILELTVDSAQSAGDKATADRARIGYAEVFGLWRDRARAIVETWDKKRASAHTDADERAIANLRRELLTGRLNHKRYVNTVLEAITACDRQKMLREALALRSRLTGESSVSRERAQRTLRDIDEHSAHADNESLSLYGWCARLRMAKVAGEADRLAALGEKAEATAAKYYARADEADRVWLAAVAAQMADLSGRRGDRDAWFKHQVNTLRHQLHNSGGPHGADDDPLPAIDLVEAARELDATLTDTASVRALIEQARRERADGQLDRAIELLEEARSYLPNTPECWPAARELHEEVALVCRERGDHDRAIAALERSIRCSRKLGQYDAAVESLGRATYLARSSGGQAFFDLHADLMELADDLGSVDQLDRAFDICFDLLGRAQRQPAFDETEPMRLEDALEAFVTANSPVLQKIGAGSLRSKWDAMLAQIIEHTKQMDA